MKIRLIFFCALLAVRAAATDTPKKPDVCCAPLAAAAFTRDSLYQIETAFTDDAGRPVQLGQLRGRPVVITMFFASCGYACPLLVADMQAIREQLPAAVREQVGFVLVSFDSERDTPAALRHYREERGLGDGWILLHGDVDAVRELAALLGVKYKEDANGQFAHSNVITVLNARGEIVHQQVGLGQDIKDTVRELEKLLTN